MFAGGGEKPPEVTDVSGQDDEEDGMVPGFSYGSGPSGGGDGFGSGFGIGGGVGGMNGNGSSLASQWWGREEDASLGAGASSITSMTAGAGTGTALPGGLSDGFGYRATPFGGADDAINSDDFIPGLGAAEHMRMGNNNSNSNSNNNSSLLPVGPRQSGPLPPQEDMWSGGTGGGGRNEDWGSGGRRGGGYHDRRGVPRRGRH